KLSNITESNNLNSYLYFHSIQDPWSWNLNGENIGTFTLSNVDQHNIALVLTMTKDQDFIGDVNINVSTPDSIAFMFNLPASHLKGIAADKPLVSTISTGSHSYEVTGLYNNDWGKETEYPNEKTSTWQNNDTAAAETMHIPFITYNTDKNSVVHELENSNGQSMSVDR